MVFGDFNLEPTNPVMINFMDSQNFTNLIKNNTCFKGVGSCIDLILTNRKYCFKNFVKLLRTVFFTEHLQWLLLPI